MPFTVRCDDRGAWRVLAVHGEIDMASAPALRQEVVREVADGSRKLIIDLSDVDFIDSIGLGVLVGALKRVRTHDGELELVCPSRRLRRVFTITDLHRIFILHESLEAATGEAVS